KIGTMNMMMTRTQITLRKSGIVHSPASGTRTAMTNALAPTTSEYQWLSEPDCGGWDYTGLT
ncbi:MAG TPA: hypothetical protein VMP10_01715, partial [Chloroflexota bacterium]|nr:hypothetical protein [Chloroflexota bacterium]